MRLLVLVLATTVAVLVRVSLVEHRSLPSAVGPQLSATPGTRGFGLSDGSPSVSVIDGKSATGGDFSGWRGPILVPADGPAIGTRSSHRGGESPEPAEQPGNRGFPLTAHVLAEQPDVGNFRARLVAVDRKGREKEVPLLEPDARRSTSRFGAIPELPLRSGVEHVVTYSFMRDGDPKEIRASFRVE